MRPVSVARVLSHSKDATTYFWSETRPRSAFLSKFGIFSRADAGPPRQARIGPAPGRRYSITSRSANADERDVLEKPPTLCARSETGQARTFCHVRCLGRLSPNSDITCGEDPYLRAVALFGRRPHRPVDSPVMPPTRNLHRNRRHSGMPFSQRFCNVPGGINEQPCNGADSAVLQHNDSVRYAFHRQFNG